MHDLAHPYHDSLFLHFVPRKIVNRSCSVSDVECRDVGNSAIA